MLDPVLNQALVLGVFFSICTAQEENAVQILIRHSLEAMESSHVLVMRFHLKDETSLSKTPVTQSSPSYSAVSAISNCSLFWPHPLTI